MASGQAADKDVRRRFIDDKIRAAFRFYDVNKDGFLHADDFIALTDYISRKTGANPEQAEKTRWEWLRWMKYLQPDPSVKVDEQQLVDSCAEMRQDMENYRRRIRETISDQFDRMDFDGDGKISLEELKIFYGAVGLADEEKIKEAFNEIDKDGSGYIEREEFIFDLVRHFTCDDPVTGRSSLIRSFE